MGVILAYFILIFYLCIFITLKVIEPIYVYFYNKPLFLHWNPIFFYPKSNSKLVELLENEFIFYQNLDKKQKVYFERRLDSFIKNYSFEGKDIVVTSEMKVLIGATYVMLTFGMRDYLTSIFKRIIIYPTAYYSTVNDTYHKGEFNPRMKAVVFSWEDFLSGHSVKNNINLGLHEFTHVLLFHALKNKDTSAIIFQTEFKNIGKYFDTPDFLYAIQIKNYFREYAYTNKFEFLAVLFEHFFETPAVFKAEFPELFEQVKVMLNYKEIQ